MNIQIFGIKKCSETRKAERYFKERKVKYQFIDLTRVGLSKGELQSVKAALGLNSLINKESKEYERLNLRYIVHNTEEVILENPQVYKTPIVRNGKMATVGYQPEIWKKWE